MVPPGLGDRASLTPALPRGAWPTATIVVAPANTMVLGATSTTIVIPTAVARRPRRASER
jgi:hypothetical protein